MCPESRAKPTELPKLKQQVVSELLETVLGQGAA